MSEVAEVRLLAREGCHLCELAAAELRSLGIQFQTIDVESDMELLASYGDSIPVLLYGDTEVARAPIDAATLRRALSRAGISREAGS